MGDRGLAFRSAALLLVGVSFVASTSAGCRRVKEEERSDDVDTSALVPVLSPVPLPRQPLRDETFAVQPGAVLYFGGDYTISPTTVTRRYQLSASAPVEVYVVPSQSDWKLMANGDEFVHLPACRGIQVLEYDHVCTESAAGGIVIANRGSQAAVVRMKILPVQ